MSLCPVGSDPFNIRRVCFRGIAYFVSLGFAKSAGFFEKALYAYTIYGAAITPVLVAALFWKKASKVAEIISIVSGIVTTLLWKEADFIRAIVPEGIYNTMDSFFIKAGDLIGISVEIHTIV